MSAAKKTTRKERFKAFIKKLVVKIKEKKQK